MEDFRYQNIIRFLQNELDGTEKKALAQWRAASTENEKRFQEVKFLWEKSKLTAPLSKNVNIDVAAALANVHDRLPGKSSAKIINLRKRFVRVAAAAAVVLMVGVFWMVQPSSVQMAEVTTTGNEQKKVVLPDKSIVWLNGNSTLTYPEKFGKNNREVRMEGDLVFEVSHNKEKPFIVKTDDLAVKVLGTKFNINSSKNNNAASFVHVINGKVKVQRDDLVGNQLILEKGMSGMLNQQDSLFITKEFSPNRLFWLNKELVFDGMPLEKVIEDLEYVFDVKIEVDNPAILNCPFAGKFGEGITVEEILESMTYIFNVEIENKESQFFKINKGDLCQ